MSANAVFIRSKKKKALACVAAGRFQDARALFTEVCRLDSRDAEAWFLQGAVNGQLGLLDESADCCRQAIALNPDYADAHYNLAQACMHRERWVEAAASYREVLRLNPDHADAHNNLGHALELQGLNEEAIACFRAALRLKRDHADAWNNLGNAMMALGANTDAIDALRQALRFRPDFIKAHINLGFALFSTGLFPESREHFDRVLSLEPGNTDAIVGQAAIYEKRGDLEPAWRLLLPLWEEGLKDPRFALVFAKVARHFGREAEATTLLEDQLSENRVRGLDQQPVHFLLGSLYDKRKMYDRAFPHYSKANSLKSAGPDRLLDEMRAMLTLFTSEFVACAPCSANTSQRPVFIVGMPRSGTTLVEQILASHPAVFGGGELEDMRKIATALPGLLGTPQPYPQCLEHVTQDALDAAAERYLNKLDRLSPDAARVTDKMPHNFVHLGLISLLFPRARVIHCQRHPLDTCLSIYTFDFNATHAYATDLTRLGQHYRQYQQLMEHWKQVLPIPMLEVRYEDMVADQEGVSRAMIAFCGLDWDERCLRFYESKRVVNTISYDQVRRPIYKQSVARWKHYEPYLGPLKVALGLREDGTLIEPFQSDLSQ